MATAVHALCHDPPSGRKNMLGKSILTQMSLKKSLPFLSTALEVPIDSIPFVPLAMLHCGDGVPWRFEPHRDMLRDHWRWLTFRVWYEATVFRTPQARTLSRKSLVLAMRNQDNGSHADEAIRDEEYSILRQYNDFRVTRKKPATDKSDLSFAAHRKSFVEIPKDHEPVPLAHLATMRQIAFEVLQSVGELLRSKSA